eukprot:SAG22_NODE_14_length_33165_cov_13.196698_10_plen_406_part_00
MPAARVPAAAACLPAYPPAPVVACRLIAAVCLRRCACVCGCDHCLSFCFSAFPCGSTALTTAGIGSLALAFGMKQLIEDTCVTLILLIRRPFNVGDDIEVSKALPHCCASTAIPTSNAVPVIVVLLALRLINRFCVQCPLTGFCKITNITFLKTEARLLDGQLVSLIATVCCERSGTARKGRETQRKAVITAFKREDRCLTSIAAAAAGPPSMRLYWTPEMVADSCHRSTVAAAVATVLSGDGPERPAGKGQHSEPLAPRTGRCAPQHLPARPPAFCYPLPFLGGGSGFCCRALLACVLAWLRLNPGGPGCVTARSAGSASSSCSARRRRPRSWSRWWRRGPVRTKASAFCRASTVFRSKPVPFRAVPLDQGSSRRSSRRCRRRCRAGAKPPRGGVRRSTLTGCL